MIIRRKQSGIWTETQKLKWDSLYFKQSRLQNLATQQNTIKFSPREGIFSGLWSVKGNVWMLLKKQKISKIPNVRQSAIIFGIKCPSCNLIWACLYPLFCLIICNIWWRSKKCRCCEHVFAPRGIFHKLVLISQKINLGYILRYGFAFVPQNMYYHETANDKMQKQ